MLIFALSVFINRQFSLSGSGGKNKLYSILLVLGDDPISTKAKQYFRCQVSRFILLVVSHAPTHLLGWRSERG